MAVTFNLNADSTYQTIDGFGGALYFGESWLYRAETKDEVMQFAFDSINGLGMSLFRIRMPYATNDVGNPDGLFQNYSLEPREGVWRLDSAEATKWCIKKAKSFGAKVLMTPWSPPEWMKTNGSVYGGGSLRGDMKAKYANYLAKNIQFFDSAAGKIDFFSLQNEPLQNPYWQSCVWR